MKNSNLTMKPFDTLLGKLCHLLGICHSKKLTSANAIIGAIGAHLGMCFESNCYLR
jgi:hypothetical protein